MFLDDIAAAARRRVGAARERVPLEVIRDAALKRAAETRPGRDPVPAPVSGSASPPPFEAALSPASPPRRSSAPGSAGMPAFICEVKRASPSRGIIARDFPYLDIAGDYEAAGAAAISVLTEPDYFMGSDAFLSGIAAAVALPVLRKDFIVDLYQIYEARLLGAAAVLLICALLGEKLDLYLETARSLGLSALTEAHTEDEVKRAAGAGARIIGINNRDLKTFEVDITLTGRLRGLIPGGILAVSESGIATPEDVRLLSGFGVDALLVGESLMRAADRRRRLAELRDAALPGDRLPEDRLPGGG
ncbi:MAG: indole-3-glycerol phosphate synthase TrpC [Spirochaetaceae bacterium]|nr:indole-3-glycerol phosphate synthase TrpC [Spirochaetaceae bacterium]